MKNTSRLSIGLKISVGLICLAAPLVFSSCGSDDPSSSVAATASPTPTPSAPTVSDKTLSFSGNTTTNVTVTWSAASDTLTTQSDLQYRVVYSNSNNISTLEDAEANGTEGLAYTANTTSTTITGLSLGTTYYFNVIVKNSAGLKTAYTSSTSSTTCFLPDTLITLADGSQRRIDQMMAGDLVKSYDENGQMTLSMVAEVLVHQSRGYVTLTAGNARISGTANHPFFTASKDRENPKLPGFRNLGDFRIGDRLFVEGSLRVLPSDVNSLEYTAETVTVYNLHLTNGPETYFANGFAVHNY